MAIENLIPDGRAAVVKLLRETIAADPYPLSPRIRRLKSALAKLDPDSAPAPKPASSPAAPPRPYKPSLLAQRKVKRRLRDGRI